MERSGVLFDVDGTLVDSSYIHAVCWWQTFRQAGLDVRTSAIHRAVGMGADHLVPHLLGPDADVDVDELAATHAAIYTTWWSQLRPMPGARDLLRHTHDAGLVVVLASSAPERELEMLRGVLDADAWIDATTSASDSEKSKPAPDLIQIALERADLPAAQAIYVGDAVWDVHAAAAAGVRCIGLECGGSSEAEMREAGAVEVHRDPADLLEHWDGSLMSEGAA